MYTSYFGLKESPFNLTPDPRYLYLSPYHKEALDHLLYGINERKGFIVITGGIGTGKTTLCRTLLSQLDTQTKSALVFSSFISGVELLKIINHEFGIQMDPADEGKKDYVDALNKFLLKTFSDGGNSVLLMDEAQNLTPDHLEQIRMLSNLETEREKLIQIVLVGQSELGELLATPSLKQLNERVTVRYHLKPLDRQDVKRYVEHRMLVAGNRGNLTFTNSAFKKIFSYSQGNARRVNVVCDRALLVAYAREAAQISKSTVAKAIVDLSGGGGIVDSYFQYFLIRRGIAGPFLVMLLIMVAGLAGWSLREPFAKLLSRDQNVTIHKTKALPHEPEMSSAEDGTLLLDEPSSLLGLFRLFHENEGKNHSSMDTGRLSIFSAAISPEYYSMLKKPFRISIDRPPLPRNYLLIREKTGDGAVALDARFNEHEVTNEFIAKNPGRIVSWVYLQKSSDSHLSMGMGSPNVLRVQKALNKIGYPSDPTGVYDKKTFDEIMRMQGDFGLTADGIVGSQTMALLYLLSD